MRRQRVFDWRFVIAFTALLAVAYLVVSGLQAAREVHASGHRADVLIQRLQEQERDAATKMAADARERAVLIDIQERLLRKYSHLEVSQRRLLRWLRAHGIQVPTQYVTTPRAPRAVRTTSSGPGAAPHRHRRQHAATAPAPAPVPAAPKHGHGRGHGGRSATAPGHLKH